MKAFLQILGVTLYMTAQPAMATVSCHFSDGAGTFASVIVVPGADQKDSVRVTKTVGDSLLSIILSKTDSGSIKASKKNDGLGFSYLEPQNKLGLAIIPFVGISNKIESALIDAKFQDQTTGEQDTISGLFSCNEF